MSLNPTVISTRSLSIPLVWNPSKSLSASDSISSRLRYLARDFLENVSVFTKH